MKTIFFDRDGTLIYDKVYLNDPDQIEYLPGAFEALKQLRDGGFQFVIVTNQSGIARGLVTLEKLSEIHARMRAEFLRHGLQFAGIYFSPHAADSNHPSRKPNPGMLLTARDELGLDLSRSWMIGDRMGDVEAGHRAGCKTVLLAGAEVPSDSSFAPPTIFAHDLLTAAAEILKIDQRK